VTGLFGLLESVASSDKHRRIEVDGLSFEWTLTRCRRRSVGMLFQEGAIRVRAPRWVSIGEIEEIIRSKRRWLMARHREWLTHQDQRLEPTDDWRDGSVIQFLGQPCTLRLSADQQQATWVAQTAEVWLTLPNHAGPEQVRDSVHAWLQQQAKEILAERLETLAQRAGAEFSRFSLSNAKTRWGSCTQDGHIRLNWRLIHFSLPVIDYVVAHELAHLRAMDHSPAFWQEVQQILPGFEEGQREIRKAPLYA